MPVAGQLVDKLKAQGLLVGGGIIAAIGLVVFGLSNALWMFYTAGIIIGVSVGLSAQYVPVVVVNRWFFKNKGTVMGIVLAGSGVGGVLLGLVLPYLLGGMGWRGTAFFLAAFFAFFTIVPSIFLVRNSPLDHNIPGYGEMSVSSDEAADSSGVEPGLTQKEAFSIPWFYVLIATYLLFGITYAMTQHFVNYLSNTPWGIDVSPGKISAVVITAALSLIAFKPLIGVLIDKMGLPDRPGGGHPTVGCFPGALRLIRNGVRTRCLHHHHFHARFYLRHQALSRNVGERVKEVKQTKKELLADGKELFLISGG